MARTQYPKTRKIDVSDCKNIHDVLDKAEGNWTPQFTDLLTDTGATVNFKKGIVRSDNNSVIGVVGNSYECIDNSEAFSFFDEIVNQNKASYKQYIEFEGGRKITLIAKYDQNFEVKVGDEVEKQIVMQNSFDGTSSFHLHFFSNRLVCSNGMTRNDKLSSVSVVHSKSKSVKLAEALKIISKADESYEQFKEQCISLTHKIADHQMVDSFLNGLLKVKDPENIHKSTLTTKNHIIDLFQNGKGNFGETVWDLYNGVTEFVDHHKGKDEDSRLKASLIGQGLTMKNTALKLALEI